MIKKIALLFVFVFSILSLSFTSANFTPTQKTTVMLNKLYMRIDIIAEKNSTKLSVIKIKLETLGTKIKNQEINYIVSELINYIENSLAKIEIDEAISIDDDKDDDKDTADNGNIDFTISGLKQNQNNSFTIQISNIGSKDYDIGHSEKKQSLGIYCREYTNEKNEILLETNDFIGAINQNTWSGTFELKQTQQGIFTIKCEVNKYQDIVESNKDNNSIMW